MFGSSSDFKPHADIFRQELRHHQVPGKELHDQRHVAKQFDIAGANAREEAIGDRA